MPTNTEPTPKIALVTGAGSGIGRTTALLLHSSGYSVIITGRRLKQLEETATMASPSPTRIFPVAADVADPESVNHLFAAVRSEFGRLDVLFNNAGTNIPAGPMEDVTFEQWNQVIGANLTGSFLCAQQAVRLMKSQTPSGGRIINNGSISAHVPRPNSAPYTAAKHAITGLTKSLALDGRAHNIVSSQIDIGNAATDMTSRMSVGVLQADGTMKPEARIDAKHIAEAVLYMANLPLDVSVPFITVMASQMPFAGRG